MFAFPFFLEQISTANAAIAKASTLANLPPRQALIRAVFFRFTSVSVIMATSDHVPEVCFQVHILKMPVATLYFICPQIYFIRFLGNRE